jgi:hypothetical protein
VKRPRVSVVSVVAFLLTFAVQLGVAAEQIVELRLQKVASIEGVIVYPNGEPVNRAQVVEFSPDWKAELRRTETDSAGHFKLNPVKGRKTYYLQITALEAGVNPLRVPVQISRWATKKPLRLALQLA